MSSSLVGKVLGKYRIVEKLASGRLADVFKGIQIGLDREVAIKVLPAALAQDREMVKRFRRESQATAKLSHPNIITIFDSGEQDGTFFYVMEFLKSESLEDVLDKERPLAVPRATKVGQDMLKALVYCHEKGVVHGDLKAAHIKFDLRENAVITDFASEPGPAALDPRVDLLAVGRMLEGMLAGAELPEELARYVARATGADAGARHQTAKEMLADLKKIELKLKAKQQLTRPVHVSRPPSAVEPSVADAPEPSALPPREALSRMLTAGVPVFLAGVALVVGLFVWLRPSPPPEPPPPAPVVTRPPAPPALVISAEFVDAQTTRAVITWDTSVQTDSSVRFGPTAAYGEVRANFDEKSVAMHAVTLEGLKPDTDYHYRIVATDADGRTKTSEDQLFRTRKIETPESGLRDLINGYIDKLSRMTPDERKKLDASLTRFTDLPQALTAAEKAQLAARPTDPKDESDFATRLRQARRWIVDLALARKDVSALEAAPGRLFSLNAVNRVTAARQLDRFLRQLAEAERK